MFFLLFGQNEDVEMFDSFDCDSEKLADSMALSEHGVESAVVK